MNDRFFKQKWDGTKFVRISLSDIGLVVQLGHDRGTCPHPSNKPRRVVIGHITGVQAVNIRFCECLDDNCLFTPEWCQLFRYGWFPASTHSPATGFTFDLLDTFQELNFQGKTNLFDFWKTIERITDNTGGRDVFVSLCFFVKHLVYNSCSRRQNRITTSSCCTSLGYGAI